MTANATRRSVRSLMRKVRTGDKLNILTFPTHERYEENLCKTGHNFYALDHGKKWVSTYAKIPDNYHIISSLPEHIDFDLILSHTSCERLTMAHDILSGTKDMPYNKLSVPILRHCHILPNPNNSEQTPLYKTFPVDQNSFISEFNMKAWGYDKTEAAIIEHGIDTAFWKPDESVKRDNVCLSVVNDWIDRDWCCGFGTWASSVGLKTKFQLPVRVLGDTPGLSEAAKDSDDLRRAYQASRIFYNTSSHSPVPTVLLEAMSCGCAIVSTNTCMIPEVIEHGKNGLLSNDPNELRSFLEMLLNNEELASKLGSEARKTICERYNLKSFVDGWNNLFNDTIENYRDTTEVHNESIS